MLGLLLLSSALAHVMAEDPTTCNGPQRKPAFKVRWESECAVICAGSAQCSSYVFKASTNGSIPLCQLLDKFNDNFMSETIEVDPDATLKLALNWYGATYFIKPPANLNAETMAINAGFTFKMSLPSLNVTRYLMRVNRSDNSIEFAERFCAESGGMLIHEYNQEVSDALKALFGPSLPNRHLAIRILKTMDDQFETVWTNGLKDWGQSWTGTCSKYQTWTSTDWAGTQMPEFTAFVSSDVDGGISPGQATPLPNYYICQYLGQNHATGKDAGAASIRSGYPANIATDGNWWGNFYHGNLHNGEGFYYVDLADEFVVKQFIWLIRDDCCGDRIANVELFVGRIQPTYPLDKSKFSFCASHPYQSAIRMAFNGMTCDRWTVGRYAIIKNNNYLSIAYKSMQLIEVGVFGFKLAEFGKI